MRCPLRPLGWLRDRIDAWFEQQVRNAVAAFDPTRRT